MTNTEKSAGQHDGFSANVKLLLPYLCLAAILSGIVCYSVYRQGGCRNGLLILMFAVWFIVFYAAELLLLILSIGAAALWVDTEKPVTRLNGFYSAYVRYLAGMACAVTRTRIHFKGEDKLPKGRWLLVCNHRSGFDILVTLYALRKHDLAFIMKPSIMRIPAVGRLAHQIGCLPIDREDDRAALRTILTVSEMMKSGISSFCVYPEGTRNREEGLLPFRNGAFKAAQKAKVPVVVSLMENTDRIPKNTPFRHTDVYFSILETIQAEEVRQSKTVEVGARCAAAMEYAMGIKSN